MGPFRSVVEAMQIPRIIRLDENLFCAAFDLMKLLPARYILDRARERGELSRDTTVLETSSGTFGLGLAMVCRLRGNPLVVVGDPAIDADLRRRMSGLGARVEIVELPHERGGYQQARLDLVDALRAHYPDHYLPRQYENPDQAAAYTEVAELVMETVGPVDCLVGPVGSGGSTGGTAAALRQDTDVWLVGVDTHGSVIFGLPDQPRLLRGLGNSLRAPNVVHSAYDEVHWTTAAEAFAATRRLHAEHCLFMGPTSGAAYLVARWWAARNRDARVVVLLPDSGHRYSSTVYRDSWLRDNGVDAAAAPRGAEPVLVDRPDEIAETWSRLLWSRRELDEVIGALV